jgi:pyruvate dehydrogenase E1 component
MAAGTAYANHGVSMVPFYIYYSMFGFQRVGDFTWAAGDMQARGFLIGGTAGRTTLAGEGLQHQDGHSHLLASTIPNCVSYDPAFACELAVIIHSGLTRMYVDQENVFFYVTCMNENYTQPALPEGAAEAILKGCHLFREGGKGKVRVQLLGSGTILREVLEAARLLEQDFEIPADVWSVTSFNELRRDAMDVDRWNRLHPREEPRRSFVEESFAGRPGPFVAATDYMALVPDQIRQWVPGRYVTLGTDGYGRSDGRQALREHFEVDRHHIAVAALKALVDDGQLDGETVAEAIKRYRIDADKPNPVGL